MFSGLEENGLSANKQAATSFDSTCHATLFSSPACYRSKFCAKTFLVNVQFSNISGLNINEPTARPQTISANNILTDESSSLSKIHISTFYLCSLITHIMVFQFTENYYNWSLKLNRFLKDFLSWKGN